MPPPTGIAPDIAPTGIAPLTGLPNRAVLATRGSTGIIPCTLPEVLKPVLRTGVGEGALNEPPVVKGTEWKFIVGLINVAWVRVGARILVGRDANILLVGKGDARNRVVGDENDVVRVRGRDALFLVKGIN